MINREGTIAIENGLIDIKDPEGLGRYPRVIPGENVIVKINGKNIKEETVVNSNTNIILEKIETHASKDFQLDVSKDKLEAYLGLKITPSTEVEIIDSPPSNQVVIKGKIIKEEYPEISSQEIMGYLRQKNIINGIIEDAVLELTKTREGKRILIARGTPAQKGKNARLVPVKISKKEMEQAFNYIDSFAKGEIIAEKKYPVPGKNGKDVYGKISKAPPVNDINIVAGDGVVIMGNGRKVVAVKNGMPKIINKKYKAIVRILPQYILEGDIDKKTGNLKFEGDLIVTGNINDYFDVKVGNNLLVKGNIANSKIDALGSVLVKNNIIACNITAGLYVKRNIKKKLQKLVYKIENLLEAINEIIGEAASRIDYYEENYQIGRIVRILVDKKFKDIIPLIKEINSEQDDLPANLSEIFVETINMITGYKKLLKLKNVDVFIDLKEEIEEVITIEKDTINESNVYTNYMQKSRVNVSGDVIIKRGCYNSEIYAGNNIIVWGKKGFIKGGCYSAGNYIYVQEIGSQLSPIELNIERGFYAVKIIGTIIIKSKNDKYKIENKKNHIHLRVNDEGKIEESMMEPDMKEIKNLLKYDFIPPVKGGKK